MVNPKVSVLLDKWEMLLETTQRTAIQKIKKMPGGMEGRIKRTEGSPVVFDSDGYNAQQIIQQELIKELPEYASHIASDPPLMDGHPWLRRDFVQLYFEHYKILIQNLRSEINV